MDWWLHLLPARMQAIWFGIILAATLLLCVVGAARLAYEREWLMALVPAAGAIAIAWMLRVVIAFVVASLDEATRLDDPERAEPTE